jgi:hypothetical protein
MNPKELVRVLKPVLKNRKKAAELLARYGRDKFFITWTVQDVYRAGNEMEVAVTKADAIQVLDHLRHTYNSQHGVCWRNLTAYITEKVMGRPLTKREIKLFVEKDIITVQR